METTKNTLPPNVKKFFHNLSQYLDTKLLFFGSVQRSDYVPGKSDIDVDIFTDNEYSLMSKLQHYLHLSKKEFKKFVFIIGNNTTTGYKVKYKNEEENIKLEFSIYNEKFRHIIIKEHTRKFVMPFYLTCLLCIIKTFYYTLPILSKSFYIEAKNWLLDTLNNPDVNAQFIVLDEQ
jgi:predicted nucleotidyltransferase